MWKLSTYLTNDFGCDIMTFPLHLGGLAVGPPADFESARRSTKLPYTKTCSKPILAQMSHALMVKGMEKERSIWSNFILSDPLVLEEWLARRGTTTEFSADDAAMLISSMAQELKALRTPHYAELQRHIDTLLAENIELRSKLK